MLCRLVYLEPVFVDSFLKKCRNWCATVEVVAVEGTRKSTVRGLQDAGDTRMRARPHPLPVLLLSGDLVSPPSRFACLVRSLRFSPHAGPRVGGEMLTMYRTHGSGILVLLAVFHCRASAAAVHGRCVRCSAGGSDDKDSGLPRAEVHQALQRLFAIPTTAYTNAYGEAGADMRPAMPTFTFGPEDGGIMKLAMPSFALRQNGNARSVGRDNAAATTSLAERAGSSGSSDSVMSALLGTGSRGAVKSASGLGAAGSGLREEVGEELGESGKWTVGSQWLSLAQKSSSVAPAHSIQHVHSMVAKPAVAVEKTSSRAAQVRQVPAAARHASAKKVPAAAKQKQIQAAVSAQQALQLHAKTMQLHNGAALSASALASADAEGERIKAMAQARLMKKSLASMKHEHTDASDAGPSMHAHGKKAAGLDGQISGSGKWLAKAVMILATVAGTCICGGICGKPRKGGREKEREGGS